MSALRWDESASKRHANLVDGMNTPVAQPQDMQAPCIVMQRATREQPGAHREDTRKTAYLSHFLGMEPAGHRTSLTSTYYECEGIMHNHAHRPKWPETLVGLSGMRI
jgi:hypothetical protein